MTIERVDIGILVTWLALIGLCFLFLITLYFLGRRLQRQQRSQDEGIILVPVEVIGNTASES